MNSSIYKLTLQNLQEENYFNDLIAKNKTNDYYWSDDWSDEFYIEQARKGFISTAHETKECLVLLPELQFDYGILDFQNLHTSKNVKKIMKQNNFELCFNTRFSDVIKRISTQHKYNWLKDEYVKLMLSLYKNKEKYNDFKIVSIELTSKEDNSLIAGEIGYTIGKTYTSLSGFSSQEKKYSNYGTLQLVLLAKHLENLGFSFWNLGHPCMEYKQKLGSVTHSREDFLKRWNDAVQHETINLVPFITTYESYSK